MLNQSRASREGTKAADPYPGSNEMSGQTEVERLTSDDYAAQPVHSTPAFVKAEERDDLQDYHCASRTSSVMHSKRLSASNSLDVLQGRHERQPEGEDVDANQSGAQLQTMMVTQVEQFHELDDSIRKDTIKKPDQQDRSSRKPEVAPHTPSEVTKIEQFVNESVDYTDMSCQWLPSNSLINRRNSRYRRKFDASPAQLIVASQIAAGASESGAAGRGDGAFDQNDVLKLDGPSRQSEKASRMGGAGAIGQDMFARYAQEISNMNARDQERKKSASVASNKSMKISLSKVKLHGEKEALKSKEAVAEALNTSQKRIIKLRRTSKQDLLKLGPTPQSNREHRIGAQQPSTTITTRSVNNLIRFNDQPTPQEMSTYGLPVKANVNLNLIKMIVSKSSHSLAVPNSSTPAGSGGLSSLQADQVPQDVEKFNSAIILQNASKKAKKERAKHDYIEDQ